MSDCNYLDLRTKEELAERLAKKTIISSGVPYPRSITRVCVRGIDYDVVLLPAHPEKSKYPICLYLAQEESGFFADILEAGLRQLKDSAIPELFTDLVARWAKVLRAEKLK